MQRTIRRIQLQDAEGFRACLDSVARERKYLAQVEAPPLEKVRDFVAQSVEQAGFKHEGRTACALRFEGKFYTGMTMALLQGPARVT